MSFWIMADDRPTTPKFYYFTKTFDAPKGASFKVRVCADSRYVLYLNGHLVSEGPCQGSSYSTYFETEDLTPYLTEGENVIAVHTLYQGLVNRVWQSGDHRHGLLCDVEVDGHCVACSGEDFLVALHTGYTESGVCGYQTQFLETYDCRAPEVGFENPDFDDRDWANASICIHFDEKLG